MKVDSISDCCSGSCTAFSKSDAIENFPVKVLLPGSGLAGSSAVASNFTNDYFSLGGIASSDTPSSSFTKLELILLLRVSCSFGDAAPFCEPPSHDGALLGF